MCLANNLHGSHLVKLYLSCNHLQSEAMKALSDCFSRCPVLEVLHLDENNIDEDGMADLTKGMKYCSLKDFSISFNDISKISIF